MSLTARDLSEFVGRTGIMPIGMLRIPVLIVDARSRYGSIDVQVTPVGGQGSQWITAARVKLDDKE